MSSGSDNKDNNRGKTIEKAHTITTLDPLRHLRSSPTPLDEEAVAVARSTSPRPPQTARAKSGKLDSPHGAAFTAYQDTSTQNARRHNTARADTFNTPSKLQKDQPTRIDKKWGLVGDMPFNDLLWICEQSFRKEASSLGKEVLAIARAEFTNVTENLLRDVRQPVEVLSENIVPKVGKILQEVEAPAKVDWMPAHDEFSNQRDQLAFLQQQFTDEVTFLKSELQGLHKQQEQASSTLRTNVQQVRDEVRDLQLEVMKRSERQVTQVLNVQQTLVAECAQVMQAVSDLQQEVQLANAELLPSMEATLVRHVHETPVNVDFSEVCGALNKNHADVDQDLKGIAESIDGLKGDLHTDFVQKIDAVMGVMERQLAATMRLDERAAEDKQEVFIPHNLRDQGAQTDAPSLVNSSAQTDGKVIIPKKLENKEERDRSREQQKELERQEQEKAHKEKKDKIFNDGENLKKKARQALMRPQYSVTSYYKDSGWAQALAKNWLFEYFTFFVIFSNAIWIAVDIDNNEAAILIDADPIFQVVENIFCTYFFVELFVRFMAFKFKRDCFRDGWFVFDTVLVATAIVETWIVTVVVLAAGGAGTVGLGGDMSIMRMFRMIKMVRLSRMARLLRAIPELLVLLKAVGAAVRSMMVFFLMWLVVIYVFAVVFRQLTEGQDVGKMYFDGVPAAMNTLVIEGILPENTKIMTSLTEESVAYWPLMVSFILLTSITLMYMLIGVLTEVIHFVARNEKEGMVVTAVASRMRQAMRNLGRHEDVPLSKMEFQELLVHPEVVQLCADVGVNVIVLVDMSDVIFESCDKEGEGINFEALVEVVLNMRGTNPATVKDVKEQLRVIKGLVNESSAGMLQKFSREFRDINQQLTDLRKLVGDEDEPPIQLSS